MQNNADLVASVITAWQHPGAALGAFATLRFTTPFKEDGGDKTRDRTRG